jgi:importin-4
MDVLTNEEDISKICDQVLAVIKGKHPCQLDEELDEEEELEEYSEYDWLVVETAMDVLVGLAKALRQHFAPLWQQFEKAILKHASSEDGSERAAATGTIAECIRGMNTAVTPYTHSLMKMALHRMGDEDIVAKANAIYAAGLLCQYSSDRDYILKQYSTILRKLEPQLSNNDQGHLLDNAAGCVARMIIAYPENVPLDEVLPVLLDLAPAKEDYEVNSPIYQCIVKLCMSSYVLSYYL